MCVRGLAAEEQERCCHRLQRALSCFDAAAIYTIHGFCRRLLCDFAYESGLQFETELITAQEQLVQEAVDDFWRIHAASASLLLSDYLMCQKIDPDSMKKLALQVLRNPLMRVVPEAAPVEIAEPENHYSTAFNSGCAAVGRAARFPEKAARHQRQLKAHTYKPAAIAGWFEALDIFFSMPEPLWPSARRA